MRFADVRGNAPRRFEAIAVRDGEPERLSRHEESGIGIRVLRRCGWGFAATSSLTRPAVREAARTALRLARLAEATRKRPIPWTEEAHGPRGERYETPLRKDPFELSLEEKLGRLREAEARLHGRAQVRSTRAQSLAWSEERHYANSEGVSYSVHLVHVGAGIEATAVGEGEVQRRSYPTSFGGDFAQGGWEFVEGLGLEDHAEECARTAEELLHAPAAPTGRMDIVLASDQLALQVHESVGHATELDRVLGYEAGFAGTSFLSVGDLGELPYGSPAMSVESDATLPGGLGSFPWDDEGVPTHRYPLVEKGTLVGFLSSRSTAPEAGFPQSGATCRAAGWSRTPLIRMTNVNLAPGERSPEELLSEVKEGLYFETNRSWSIDDRRLNFQFGTEVGRRIVKGELGPLVRNPIYSGMTPQFWGRLAAVSDRGSWHLWGIPNCGKGQPGQVGLVGHGAPWGLFTDVQVGLP